MPTSSENFSPPQSTLSSISAMAPLIRATRAEREDVSNIPPYARNHASSIPTGNPFAVEENNAALGSLTKEKIEAVLEAIEGFQKSLANGYTKVMAVLDPTLMREPYKLFAQGSEMYGQILKKIKYTGKQYIASKETQEQISREQVPKCPQKNKSEIEGQQSNRDPRTVIKQETFNLD